MISDQELRGLIGLPRGGSSKDIATAIANQAGLEPPSQESTIRYLATVADSIAQVFLNQPEHLFEDAEALNSILGCTYQNLDEEIKGDSELWIADLGSEENLDEIEAWIYHKVIPEIGMAGVIELYGVPSTKEQPTRRESITDSELRKLIDLPGFGSPSAIATAIARQAGLKVPSHESTIYYLATVADCVREALLTKTGYTPNDAKAAWKVLDCAHERLEWEEHEISLWSEDLGVQIGLEDKLVDWLVSTVIPKLARVELIQLRRDPPGKPERDFQDVISERELRSLIDLPESGEPKAIATAIAEQVGFERPAHELTIRYLASIADCIPTTLLTKPNYVFYDGEAARSVLSCAHHRLGDFVTRDDEEVWAADLSPKQHVGDKLFSWLTFTVIPKLARAGLMQVRPAPLPE